MLSRRTESARVALFIMDQVLLAAAFAGAMALEHLIAPGAREELAPGRLYLVTAPLLAAALGASGFYRIDLGSARRPRAVRRHLLGGGFLAMTTVVLVGFVVEPLAGDGSLRASRALAFLFMATATAGLGLSRLLLRAADSRGEPAGLLRVVVFGTSPRLLRLLGALQRTPHVRVHVLGVAAPQSPVDVAPRLDTEAALALLEQSHVDHVLVDAESLPPGLMDEVLGRADAEGISTHITSTIFPSTRLVPSWERIGGVPVLGFVSGELPLGARIAKRTFDVVVSAAALVLLALPMAVIAALVRWESPGPALFVQRRVGAHGRVFRMLKFRTMGVDAEARTGPVFATERDPRCTPLGAFLRRWNLDELPQFLNVLRGQMSLVGPRPERPEFVSGFKRTIPRYAHKHWVRPGITGWAQVHGLRGASTDVGERIDHDLYYIENWSLLLDIRILVRTLLDGYVNAA